MSGKDLGESISHLDERRKISGTEYTYCSGKTIEYFRNRCKNSIQSLEVLCYNLSQSSPKET